MKKMSLLMFLTALMFVTVTGHARPGNPELKNIPLEWKPTDVVSALDAIDLSALLKTPLAVSQFTDLRKTPQEIGKNVEKRGSSEEMPVTTKDNVASWLTSRFAQVLSEFDLDVVKNNPAFTIEADIIKFYVTESSTYKGDVGLKIRLKSKTGSVVWEGMASGSASRFGASYKAENYHEALSNALINMIYALLKNDQFKQAILKNK
jgi:hypothetical protein